MMEEKSLEEMREVALKVSRIFRERLDSLFSDPEVALRILSGSSDNRDIAVRRSEEWRLYLSGLEVHGVRREGRLLHMVVGTGAGEVAVDDPLSDSSLIVVPWDFAFRMVVMGGLP